MNCQDFENGLDALARGTLAEARAREEASAHAASCARCTARLADERALTEGLRELARKSKAAEAPAQVESALLAAMRARAASDAVASGVARVGSESISGAVVAGAGRVGVAPLAGDDKVTPLAGRADARRFSWVKTLAVAALAAAAVLTFFMLIPPDMSVPKPKATGEVAKTIDQNNGRRETAEDANQTRANETQDQVESAGVGTSAQDEIVEQRQKASRVNVGARQSVRAAGTPALYRDAASRGTSGARGGAEVADDEEVATDFIPLMQGAHFAQGDGGRLVRVELPRSALVSFGLPVNAETAGGRVKADVLLGEDGLARAIRFVR